MKRPLLRLGLLWLAAGSAAAQDTHAHHHHQADTAGVVMNANSERLPAGCSAISEDVAVTVHAGGRYAAAGRTFGMSVHEVRVPPCSRVTLTLVNDDAVRHQWMVHGLPRYLYPAGMFHIEAMGGATRTGTFIVPAEDRTYLIHCDIAQHMEKGMRGQLVVGAGSGDLWGVPGISDNFYRDTYLIGADGSDLRGVWLAVAVAAAVGFLLAALLAGRQQRALRSPRGREHRLVSAGRNRGRRTS